MGLSIIQLTQFSQRFCKYYNRQFTPLLARTGLSMREAAVLLFLANHPGQDTARDVVECRGLSKSQVSQAVDHLAERGILERRPDQEDRRVIHLHITASGGPLAKEAQEIQAACGRRLLENLTEEERTCFLELLGKVLEQADQSLQAETQ